MRRHLLGVKLIFFSVPQMDCDTGDADVARLDRHVRHAVFSMDVLERSVGRNGAGRPVLMDVAGGRQDAEHGDNAR